MTEGRPVRQLAYFVEDVREASLRHSALFGSGPFLVFPPISFSARHRGEDREADLTLAFGQWGSMQIEMIQQNNPGPSPFRDIFPENSGKFGFHHVATFVDDLEVAVAGFASLGQPEVARVFFPGSPDSAVFADTYSTLGHLTELYEPSPLILDNYALVADAAIGFDGHDPVRDISW